MRGLARALSAGIPFATHSDQAAPVGRHTPEMIVIKTLVSISVAVVSIIFAPSIYSQTDGPKLADADVDFMNKAAQANLAEMETGKLAQDRATRADIKQFGQKMQQAHGKTLQELQTLAKNKNVTLPEAPDEAHQALAKQLAAAPGTDFDKAYLAHAGLADHKAAKMLFEKGAKSKDPELSAFAKKALPDIQHHLDMALQLAKQP
jgi:putative membrane protein